MAAYALKNMRLYTSIAGFTRNLACFKKYCLYRFPAGGNFKKIVQWAKPNKTGKNKNAGKNQENDRRYTTNLLSEIKCCNYQGNKHPEYPVERTHIFFHCFPFK